MSAILSVAAAESWSLIRSAGRPCEARSTFISTTTFSAMDGGGSVSRKAERGRVIASAAANAVIRRRNRIISGPMCLIAIAHNASPKFPLVIAANRDELYARPTRPAHVWEDDARIVGGRDVRAGGTWLALRRGGRFGAITNVRGIGRAEGGPSRGTLVADFVHGDDAPMAYAKSITG